MFKIISNKISSCTYEYVHRIQQSPILLTNGNNNIRLKQTPQVQLRVTCQVCKKVSMDI